LQTHLSDFENAGIKLFTISYDSVEVLDEFAKVYGIQFPMLADVGSEVIRRYGIMSTLIRPDEVEHYGIPYPGTYIVDSSGIVTHKFFHREYQVRETAPTILKSGFHLPVDPSRFVHTESDADGVTVAGEVAGTVLHNRQTTNLYVTLKMAEGLHVYGPTAPEGYTPTTVSVEATEGLNIGEPAFPPTTPFSIAGLPEEFQVMDGEATIVIPVQSRIRETGQATINVSVRFQACTDSECLLPQTLSLQLNVATEPMTRAAAPTA
jgi:hypothetical protein